jgi:hypothetical protein
MTAITLEAVIEEARRRARRRHAALFAALIALLAAGGIWAGLALSGGGAPPAVQAPPGFTVVSAGGPVAHVVVRYSPLDWATTDVATGQDKRVQVSEEVWYEPQSGLWRDIYRVDGRVRTDRTGSVCGELGGHRSCFMPPPYEAFTWPPEKAGYGAAPGSFHGRDVIWLTPKHPAGPGQTTMKYAVDPETHRTIVQQALKGTRLVGESVISQRPDLDGYSFVVPKGGPSQSSPGWYEPFSAGLTRAYGLPAARKALGRTPFWLGPRFHGYALRSVVVGRYALDAKGGRKLRSAPFVRFHYARDVGKGSAVTLEEFGSKRPYFYERGPRAGLVERDGITLLRLTRGGLLMRANSDPFQFRFTRSHALAIARSLRLLPAGLKTLPTLHEQ